MKTEEANAAARSFGLPEAEITVEDSVKGVVAKVCRLLFTGIILTLKNL